MQNYECPHCHKRSISVWQKLSLVEPEQTLFCLWGRFRSLRCQNCGAEVKLRAWSELLTIVPFCVVAPLAPLFDSMAIYFTLLGESLAFGTWLALKIAPLVEIKGTIERNDNVDEIIDKYYNRY
jgi:hypothetical protein